MVPESADQAFKSKRVYLAFCSRLHFQTTAHHFSSPTSSTVITFSDNSTPCMDQNHGVCFFFGGEGEKTKT
jgi:hypothetical protein